MTLNCSSGSFMNSKGNQKANQFHKKSNKKKQFIFLSTYGEKLSAHLAGVDEFKNKFKNKELVKGLHHEQVYNIDEISLNFKV